MDLISAYSGIAKLFLMFAVGFILYRKGLITDEILTFLSKVITSIAAPALLCVNAIEYISADLFLNKPVIFSIPFIVICSCLLISIACKKLFKLNVNGSFSPLFAFSNTINLGLPICMAMFGDKSVPYIIIYYLGNTLTFWTIGAYLISKDSDNPIKFGLPVLKSIFSPPILGFMFGAVIALTGIKLPSFLFDAIDSFGGLITPLSCIYVGAFIAIVGFKRIFKIGKEGIFVLIGRFIIAPMIALGLGLLFNLPPLAITVLVIMASMPVMNFIVILTSRYQADTSLSIQMLTSTSVLMMGVVPIYLFICNLLLF